MEKLKFNTTLNAKREKVWEILWGDDTYRKWTMPFSAEISAEGSRAETDWKEGSKVLFVSGGDGMVSRIATKKPNEYMEFEHLGIVKNGVEDTTSDAVKPWAGARETYKLTGDGNQTKLEVEMDSNSEFKDYFSKTWPLALEELKKLAES